MSFLADWGFDTMQLEIFHPEQLSAWTDDACLKLKEQSLKTGITFSQFVAHFLMSSFDSPSSLYSDSGLSEAAEFSEKLRKHELTSVVTIPLPSFAGQAEDEVHQKQLDEKVLRFWEILSSHNLKLAFEPQPLSLGADLAFLKRIPQVGLNLDPGHLLCSGLDPFSLDQSILSRVMSTHLCENDGTENLSLSPGTYEKNRWGGLIGQLEEAGYRNSLDIEIICPPEDVEKTYKEGLLFLKKSMDFVNENSPV
jgi:sugar phosphate isomerase/epimerase